MCEIILSDYAWHMSHSRYRSFVLCQSKIMFYLIANSVSFALHRAAIDATMINIGIILHDNKKLRKVNKIRI